MSFKKYYSDYYNLVYEKKDYKSEVEYITKILSSQKKNINTILELGSGTGSHAKHFLGKGFNLTCVEKSKNMLANFKVRSKNLQVVNKDLKMLRLKKKFDLVISLFHVINYMTSNKDLNSFFKVGSHHLKKDGLLIFDTWYFPAVRFIKPQIKIKIFKKKNIEIIRKAVPKKLDNKNFKISYFINILDKKNSKTFKFIEHHKIRAFDIKELDIISKKFKFKKITNYAFLKKIRPNKNNWGALLIYKKI